MRLDVLLAQLAGLSLPSAPFAPAPLAPALAAAPAGSCPDDMRLVEGTHYRQVQRLCLDFHHQNCWAFYEGAVAFEWDRTPIRTCMDRYEWPNRQGEEPVVMLRYTDAKDACQAVGKRLCTEYEWELACEGPSARPYPYGWTYDPSACNNAKPYRPLSFAKLESNDPAVREQETRRLWQGAPSGAFPRCVSEHGVVDLVGNVEEWVQTSRPQWKYESSLKGGYWSKAWSGCRGTNDSHGPAFRFYEIGFRCCAEPGP